MARLEGKMNRYAGCKPKSIRPKIQEIVDNIDKFEHQGDITWGYKKIRIMIFKRNPLEISIDREELILSTKEIKFLTDNFLPKQKIIEENNKIALEEKQKEKQKDLLNSISFNEEESK